MGRELQDKVAVVTGAARGIGLGIVSSLAEEGARVVLTDIDEAALSAAVATLADSGHTVSSVAGDVADEGDVARVVEHAISAHGGLDVLVNNAARNVVTPFLEHSVADWRAVIDANLTGVFLYCREVLPHMSARGRGSVVNIGSIASLGWSNNHAAYVASKGGVLALTRELAYEFAPCGVRINAILPGKILTEMTSDRLKETGGAPIGRWGDPTDIGQAAVFLASDRSSFVVGATIVCAGGSELRIV